MIRISPSQIEDFRLCPRKWAFSSVAKLPRPQSKWAAFGEEVHAVLERWVRDGAAPPDSAAGRVAAQLIRPGWAPGPRAPGVTLEAAEQDCERLRVEVNDLRKEVNALQTRYRGEQAAIAESFGGVMDLLGQLHKPLADIKKASKAIQALAASKARKLGLTFNKAEGIYEEAHATIG